MRKLVVGDIHGGLRALKQVLDLVKPQSSDQFIFLGDYVDGWSEASETLSFIQDFSEKYDCILLRGNHDALVYDYLQNDTQNPMWLNHGGESSKLNFDRLSEEELQPHLTFFENLHNYYIDDENRLFCHAGYIHPQGPQYEHSPNIIYWDRTLWEMVRGLDISVSKDDKKFPKRLRLFNEIYIGHSPVTQIGKTKPVNIANVWNVDTGAAFKGPLSVIDVNTKEIWQSEPVWLLYPEEQGRNKLDSI